MALLAPDLVPVSLLMLMIPLNVYVAWREREALDRSGVTWTTVGRFLGTFGGLWLLTTLTSSLLNVLIGAVSVLAALAVGAVVSRLIHDRVGGRLLRVVVLLFAIVSGTVLLTRN